MPETASGHYPFKPFLTSSHFALLRGAGEGQGRRLLDVGCGEGFLAERLSAKGWKVVGIEGDPVLAERARRHCEEVLVSDLNRETPEIPGTFEAILYGDILEHLASPQPLFHRLNQSLRPGGTVILSIPNVAHLWVRLSLLFGRFEYAQRGILDRTHLRFFTRRSLRRFLEEEQVGSIDWAAIPVPLELVIPQRWQGSWLVWLQRAHLLAARCWPQGLAYQFVVKGRIHS